jgi:8-oxo-dGTP pyrophosphatase MutT (NUDIX family)
MTSGYLRHFHKCNDCDFSLFAPFYIGGKQLGWVTKELVTLLPATFKEFVPHQNGIALAAQLDSFAKRSDALADAAAFLSQRYARSLRTEMYAVVAQLGDEPLAQIDRAAVPWFGFHGFGVHVNGYVKKPDGLYLWISTRAADRQVDPGKLDNLIGGGLPIGLSIDENLCKEAKEEAGIDADLARSAQPVGTISYHIARAGGMRNDTLYLFDLELPDGYTPQNTDGEVASFTLMPVAEVAKIIHDTDKFKFNCNLVIIDFLMRNGIITHDHPEFAAMEQFLKR